MPEEFPGLIRRSLVELYPVYAGVQSAASLLLSTGMPLPAIISHGVSSRSHCPDKSNTSHSRLDFRHNAD